ncbi:MAG: hypothetical protein JXA42_20040 [Anaerolineales bacterium]|nr:hypothetical protein [Anaerolineales bacterium]
MKASMRAARPQAFPFVSFNGCRLWDWKRGVWAVLAAAAIFVFLAQGVRG